MSRIVTIYPSTHDDKKNGVSARQMAIIATIRWRSLRRPTIAINSTRTKVASETTRASRFSSQSRITEPGGSCKRICAGIYVAMILPSTAVSNAATVHQGNLFIGWLITFNLIDEPPTTRDVNRDRGTASANRRWLQRMVRPR